MDYLFCRTDEISARSLDTPEAPFALYAAKPNAAKTDALQAFCNLFRIRPAEQAVLSVLMQDANPAEIAAQLHLSLPTVRSHNFNLRQKTGTQRVTQLVRLAYL